MRRCALREILEIVMANNQSGMFGAHARAHHPGVAIGVGVVNISADKDILIIRTARPQNQRSQDYEFDRDEEDAGQSLHKTENRKSAIENRKRIWARLDSNQGPRDYESPALPLSYRPAQPSKVKHTNSLVTNPESVRGCSNR